MTAKEKSQEIFNKYLNVFTELELEEFRVEYAQVCSLTCIGVLIKQIGIENIDCKYWNDVINEINKL